MTPLPNDAQKRFVAILFCRIEQTVLKSDKDTYLGDVEASWIGEIREVFVVVIRRQFASQRQRVKLLESLE